MTSETRNIEISVEQLALIQGVIVNGFANMNDDDIDELALIRGMIDDAIEGDGDVTYGFAY